MELLGRIAAALGISLIVTLLLLVLYQDEGRQSVPATMSQAAPVTASPAASSTDTP